MQTEQGPCVECVARERPSRSKTRGQPGSGGPSSPRPPLSAGFHSVHAVPLRLRDETIGGLNLFNSAGRPQLSVSEQRIAQAWPTSPRSASCSSARSHRASHVAEQLQAALTSRIAVEQAKGVLAEHGQLDMDAAFANLRAYCRTNRLKMGASPTQIVRRELSPDDVLKTDFEG